MFACAVVGGFETNFSTVVHLLTKKYKEGLYTKTYVIEPSC